MKVLKWLMLPDRRKAFVAFYLSFIGALTQQGLLEADKGIGFTEVLGGIAFAIIVASGSFAVKNTEYKPLGREKKHAA